MTARFMTTAGYGGGRKTIALPGVTPLTRIVAIALPLMVILGKFAAPLGGDNQIEASFVVVIAAMVGMLMVGKVVIDPMLCLAGMVFTTTAVIANLWIGRAFSLPSLLFMIALYAPLVLRFQISNPEYQRILAAYVAMSLMIAGAVALQHAMQLVGGPFFNIEAATPQAFLFREYVYIQPLVWGSAFNKPNAIFLLEASVTSQFLALGIVVELATRHRAWVLLILAAALLATFAGTGLLMLVLTAPFLLRHVRRSLVIAAIIAVPIFGVVATATGWTEIIAERVTEHEKQGSSANARFVAPFERMQATLAEPDEKHVFFGIGAGNIERHIGIVWIPVAKVLVEYGLISFVCFLWFVTLWLYRGRPVFAIAWAAGLMFHLLNGSLLVPLFLYVPYFLGAAFVVDAEASGASASVQATHANQRGNIQ